jgi:hypothetical protein
MRVNGKVRLVCSAINWLLLAFDCSRAAKLAPGPENGVGCASGSAIGFTDDRMGDAKRSCKARTELDRYGANSHS